MGRVAPASGRYSIYVALLLAVLSAALRAEVGSQDKKGKLPKAGVMLRLASCRMEQVNLSTTLGTSGNSATRFGGRRARGYGCGDCCYRDDCLRLYDYHTCSVFERGVVSPNCVRYWSLPSRPMALHVKWGERGTRAMALVRLAGHAAGALCRRGDMYKGTAFRGAVDMHRAGSQGNTRAVVRGTAPHDLILTVGGKVRCVAQQPARTRPTVIAAAHKLQTVGHLGEEKRDTCDSTFT